MSKPLKGWSFLEPNPPDLAWWAIVDNRYIAEVQKIGEGIGNLCLFDHYQGDRELRCIPILLAGDSTDWHVQMMNLINQNLPA